MNNKEKLELFKIVDQLKIRILVAKNTDSDMHQVLVDCRDVLEEYIHANYNLKEKK